MTLADMNSVKIKRSPAGRVVHITMPQLAFNHFLGYLRHVKYKDRPNDCRDCHHVVNQLINDGAPHETKDL